MSLRESYFFWIAYISLVAGLWNGEVGRELAIRITIVPMIGLILRELFDRMLE